MYDPYAEFTKSVLPNGLEVHTVSWNRPWVRVEIVVHSGAREDPIDKPGLAHFVEHVVSKCVLGLSNDQIREYFETCGGQASFGTTSYTSTGYSFCIPANPTIFCEALAIFGSMILNARINDSAVETERKVITREFNEKYPFLEKMKWDTDIRNALFRGHRLETYNRPLGKPDGFQTITKLELQHFYDTHYTPANISVVIIGGFSKDEIITELEKSPFGGQKDGARNPIPSPFTPIPTRHTRIVRLSDHVNFTVDQTTYKATWAIPIGFPLEARKVFSGVLQMILFNEIRAKHGLSYNVRTTCRDYQNVWEYEISGSVNPEATEYIDDLVQGCISMVPSRQDLFTRVLNANIQRCLMVDLSGSDLAEETAGDLASYQRIITVQEVWDGLHRVTHDQMAQAAALLSPDRGYTFITCP